MAMTMKGGELVMAMAMTMMSMMVMEMMLIFMMMTMMIMEMMMMMVMMMMTMATSGIIWSSAVQRRTPAPKQRRREVNTI